MKLNDQKIQALLATLGEKPVGTAWSESGVNSRSARVQTESGRELFVKGYLLPEGDSRPRVDTEFESLRFLWQNGVRDICEPIATDASNEISVFSSVSGRRFRPEFIAAEDVQHAVKFYAALQKLQPAALAQEIPIASEACFSLNEHLQRVQDRIAALEAVENTNLQPWVRDALRPAWEALKTDFLDGAHQIELDPEAVLPQSSRILSPSDVGFHNILREDKTGRLVFIDFEYFGWDDPVKLASDFVLQPSVPLPLPLKRTFLQSLSREFKWTAADRERFLLYFPLFGFKWCLIVLNVFFPNRRPFLTGDIDALLARRLRISQKLFEQLLETLKKREYESWVA